MEHTEVNLRKHIMSQADGQMGLIIAINRYAMPVWIGIFLLIFLGLGERIGRADSGAYYAVTGGILALHVLLTVMAYLRIGGPMAQPGHLVCTDEGLHMQYCSSGGRWKRKKTIPWDKIRGAEAGPFEDQSTARARTGQSVGSGVNVSIKTRYVGLILFLGDHSLKRQVWLHTKAMGTVTRKEMTASVRELKSLAAEINERVQNAGQEPLAPDTRQELLKKEHITPLQEVAGHSPRAKSNPPMRVTRRDLGWLTLMALSFFLLGEIFGTGLVRPAIRSIAVDAGSVQSLQSLRQDVSAHRMADDTSVSGIIENPNNVPVRIESIILHGRPESIDITEYLTGVDDQLLSRPIIIPPNGTMFIGARPPRMSPRAIRPVTIEISEASLPPEE